ncbi:DNA replication/repair protein RecF [Alphaproteobacteria bacterium GH1-50]|uniref:DNA replication and repair protein RecF n=1 Tax=Kangsaoukella pontilimi TaxID=2691042 RepID=A0A7C9N0L1_9RHOB|nr:DNA replication/repair protein RecF [Kangsaoukella pontilimi]MXQ08198.1 DNA replication/repair protein RecF [Kangsaoukella pontilimi]
MQAPAVTELMLSHFRSHRLTRLSLDGRPVAIHGPNGAGKTNILEAVSLLSPGRGLRRAAAEEFIRRPEAIGWKITADLAGREVGTGAEPGQPRTVTIDGKTAPQVALSGIARVVWLVPSMDRLWIEGAEGRRRFLDRLTMSFAPDHAQSVLTYEKAMRERNRLLKDMVRDAHWYHALERTMGEAGAAITAARRAALTRLAEAQEGAETAFPAAELSLTHPEGDLPEESDALTAALADGRGTDLRAGRTLTGPHRVDLSAVYTAKGVPAGQCSTGEQKALLVSLILTNARALAEDTGAPPLILLDEVAAHLDAGRRAALYDEICALGAQAWMTGTGPELFEDLSTRAQFLAVIERDGISEVGS